MIRIVENNDWVIFTLLSLGVVYLIVFNWIQKEVSFKEYILQDYEEAQNNVLSWIIISGVFVGSFSVLFSQYVPIVPKFVKDINLYGFEINKIGFLLLCIISFYLLKAFFSLLFYKSIGQGKKYLAISFIAQRFYFVESLVFMGICIAHYYYPIDKNEAYLYYTGVFGAFFIGKILFYFFHKERPLPEEWYYKILYICTLQILPVLAVWKFIFL